MAHDIFSGETKRNWSRGQESGATSGYDPYARSLFDRRACSEPPPVIVQKEPARIGWLGATLAVMFSTRILSGKWPWYWAGLAANKLEGHSTPRKA